MSSIRSKISRAYAFTLVELLVVIGIIALLISILLPALSTARLSAGNVKCLSNLRQIGQLLAIYTNSSKGVLPYASMDYRPPNYYSSEVTSWSLTLGALLNHGGNTVYDASKVGRKVFTDDPQALEITSDFGSCYSANPMPFGVVQDPSYGYNWPPSKIAKVKNNTILIYDGAQIAASNNEAATISVALDNYDAVVGYDPVKGINSCNGVAVTYNNSTPLVGVFKDSPSYSIDFGTACSLRFRHNRNKSVNVLFVDGHANSFRPGELTKGDYRVVPR